MAEYGVKPWELELFTAEEISEVIDHQNRTHKAMRDAQR